MNELRHLEEGEVVTRFPYVNLRKDHYSITPYSSHASAMLARLLGSTECTTMPSQSKQLSAKDASARVAMKGAAKCDKHFDSQNL